jgi:cation:H+ antiporter
MPDIVDIVALAGGLVLLALAGDALVNGAVSLARKMGVSALFAGIVIVGFGTSLPEIIVAIEAALTNKEGLAFGNIVGSNIANMWLALGLPALIAPVAMQAFGLKRTLLITSIATLAWMAITWLGPLSPTIGIAFLAGLGVYVAMSFFISRGAVKAGHTAEDLIDMPDPLPLGRAGIFVLIGVVGLPVGAELMIRGATGLAEFYGISDRIIGLTLLAVGTSLPEIAAGLAAAFRRQGDVLIGNVLGSNLFNILAAGGVVALFGPFELSSGFHAYDHWFMALSLAVIALGVLFKRDIGVTGGLVLLVLYGVYIFGLVEAWSFADLFGLEVPGQIEAAAGAGT